MRRSQSAIGFALTLISRLVRVPNYVSSYGEKKNPVWSLLIMGLVGGFLCVAVTEPVTAATALDTAISNLTIQVSSLTTTVTELQKDEASLISKFQLADTGQCALWVAGQGSNGTLPMSFVSSSQAIASLQADLVIPSSFTITGVTIGAAGSAAGKSASFGLVNGAARILIFGLNQTPLGSGTIATVSYTTTSGTAPGFHPMVLTNPVASDPNGNIVPLCLTSGGVSL